ncbi:MAG: hypothetical protein AB7G38_18010, partial [Dehalococcoidia bacterium]
CKDGRRYHHSTMTLIRRIDFDEFAAQLPELLDELAREHRQVLVENKGKVFRIGGDRGSNAARS